MVTESKAKEILRHGEVHGNPLTRAQKGFFGARAGGQPVKGLKKRVRGRKSKRKVALRYAK